MMDQHGGVDHHLCQLMRDQEAIDVPTIVSVMEQEPAAVLDGAREHQDPLQTV